MKDFEPLNIFIKEKYPLTSKVLIWEAHCPSYGDVQYSTQGDPKTLTGGDGYIHKVKVLGLESGKDYCYQVISSTNETELKSDCLVFRTKPQKDGVFSFAVTSETGGSGSPMGIIERLVESIVVEIKKHGIQQKAGLFHILSILV